jgi:arylformamidase
MGKLEHRAVFDFVLSFTNGGSLQGEGFHLDVPRPGMKESELAPLLVQHLGLLMVGEVRFANLRFVEEAHRGSRGIAPSAAPTSRRLVELSHPIHHGMVTYPGLPPPEFTDHLTRERAEAAYGPGVTFQIGRLSLVSNTGTYLDSPFHRFAGATDLADLPLERMVELEGVVVRVSGSARRGVDRVQLAPVDVAGCAVLVHTGWDVHFGTDRYGTEAPFLTADGADWLVEHRAALVGIDSVNIDNMEDRSRPAHTKLLAAGIPIVEHLTGLEQLPATGFRFSSAPPRFRGVGTFAVRAYAAVDGRS